MQVFIIGTPLETAVAMHADKLRYNKQIVEAQQILDALNSKSSWSNHPCTLQYRGYERWLTNYMYCLMAYRDGDLLLAFNSNKNCVDLTPPFHTQMYFDNMKSRLYTKNPTLYARFAGCGTSETNLYFVDGEWRKYINGKRIE